MDIYHEHIGQQSIRTPNGTRHQSFEQHTSCKNVPGGGHRNGEGRNCFNCVKQLHVRSNGIVAPADLNYATLLDPLHVKDLLVIVTKQRSKAKVERGTR